MFKTITRHAVRVAIDLAEHEKATIAEMADRLDVGPKYLEPLLSELRRAGVVASKRGVHGGFRLARPAGEITVGEVVRAMEGEYAPPADRRDKRMEAALEQGLEAMWAALEAVSVEAARAS